jgi:hypothetical protein
MFVVDKPMKTNEFFCFRRSVVPDENDTKYRDYNSFLTLGGYVYFEKRFFELLATTVMISLKRLFQCFNIVSNSD